MAQAIAANTTKDFITAMLHEEDGVKKPVTVDFSTLINVGSGDQSTQKKVQVKAPLLSMVPVPHLRIDSMSTHFRYEISSVLKDSSDKDKGINTEISSGPALALWAKGSVTGSVSSRSSSESVMNRGGVLEITVNASEAPMPEGLAKILGILANSIVVEDE